MVTTKASLQRVATLFETTHDSLIFGITAVGIPELRNVVKEKRDKTFVLKECKRNKSDD